MSSVARTVAAIVLLLAVGLAHASKFPGSCPTANPNPTGCYCTNGCSVGYDTNKFRWTYPTWPPRLVSANTLGGDTICAKITFPTQNLPSDVKALAAYLGITGDIFNNGTEMDLVRTGNEVTIYTAFTQSECETFQSKASGALSGWLDALSARSLYVKLCTSEGCNTIDSEAVPDLPLVPITASGRAAAAAERFPGDCPLSNPSEIGCYCTSSCSVNNDFVNLLWTPPVWAPAQVPARIMGPDTICARVTIPIKTDTAVGREMAQFLGLYGNVSLLNPNYDDVADGTEVTIYTAFTYFECQRFQDIADRFVSRYSDARKPLVYMCTDPFCNSPGAVTTALNADTSSAFGPSMVILLLAALLLSLF